MCAYFSNATEGTALDEQCLECYHGYKDDGELAPCAVLMLQMEWNYEQHRREDKGMKIEKRGKMTVHTPIGELLPESLVKQHALEALIPRESAECNMFVANDRVRRGE